MSGSFFSISVAFILKHLASMLYVPPLLSFIRFSFHCTFYNLTSELPKKPLKKFCFSEIREFLTEQRYVPLKPLEILLSRTTANTVSLLHSWHWVVLVSNRFNVRKLQQRHKHFTNTHTHIPILAFHWPVCAYHNIFSTQSRTHNLSLSFLTANL